MSKRGIVEQSSIIRLKYLILLFVLASLIPISCNARLGEESKLSPAGISTLTPTNLTAITPATSVSSNTAVNITFTVGKTAPASTTGGVSATKTDSPNRYSLLPGQTVYSDGITGKNPRLMTHAEYQFEDCSTCHYIGATGALHLVERDHCCRECHWKDPRLPWAHQLEDNYSCTICHQEQA